MTITRLMLAFSVAALCTTTTIAAPSVDVRPLGATPSGNILWVAEVTPDASLFSTIEIGHPDPGASGSSGGSIATQLQFYSPDGVITSPTKNSAVWDRDNPLFGGLSGKGIQFGFSSLTGGGSAISFPGDYNGDGVTLEGDYTVWRDTLGSTTELQADGDFNGIVGEGDYTVWEAGYDNVSAVAAGSIGSDTLFVALGSRVLTSDDPVELLVFETIGLGPTTIEWDRYLAQGGIEHSAVFGSVTAQVPEPSAMLLALSAIAAVAACRRKALA